MKFEINRDLVQKIIDVEISPDFIIDNIYDTQKYIFIGYKHRNYDEDDERGHLVGIGPIVYNKETGEYKLLGSGEYMAGDYIDYLRDTNAENEIPAKSLEQIISRIKQRKYVNADDHFFFMEIIEKEHPEFTSVITHDRNLNLSEHFIFKSENLIIQNKIIAYWKIFNFPYQIRNQNEIVLWRTEKHLLTSKI
ncbi:hypothetical protein EV144_105313 [Flavobacterium sp. 270]|uniref:hypothetical protein n=1 Tax=Flavobacterium sp. 270 TaxID=2512114 RepID=UPI00106571DB|nr:hypothetical protein [Flavobacterium sp. 270]TDW47294.1 hypothetical protein EV144_105313 [Flavobacterium sp. 270]